METLKQIKGYFVPHEVPLLLGDPSKAKEKLGWEPKTKFSNLAGMMYHSDFHLATQELQKIGLESSS